MDEYCHYIMQSEENTRMEVKLTKVYTVSEEMLAVNVGSGSLRVLATPVLAAFFEETSAELAGPYLEEDCTSVGTKISVDHLAPTPLGGKVAVTACLTEREGRVFRFRLEASDEAGKIAEARHERVSVKAARFVEKAEARKKA